MPPLHAASHTLVVTAVMSGVAGLLFLLVWSLRHREQVYGWFGLMSLVWVYYLSTFLDETPWTFADTLTRLRSNLAALVVYVLCFCRFTWSFGRQHLPQPERWLTIWALISIAVVALVPIRWAPPAFLSAWLSAAAIFLSNCLQFQWRAWRSREPRQLILAGCCLVLFATAVHDMPASFGLGLGSWATIGAPTVTVVIVLLLALQLLTQMRHIESANLELRQHVDTAATALSDALEREHSNAVRHAQLQERLNLAHDLHDGMGSTLVRNMALLEQASQPLPNARILSLLKVLRDDLRQVMDQAAATSTDTPDTPLSWAAPLRARFTRVFDALGMQADWLIAPEWRFTPSPLQCLMLSRIVEEALSNVIQHSQAERVQISLQWREQAQLLLIIEDNGRGFDVAAVQASGQSVGLRSMAARVARIGGVWQMTSQAGSTILTVTLSPPGLPA